MSVTPAEAAWETAAKGFFDAVHQLAANYPGVQTDDVIAKAQEFQAQGEALRQVYQAMLGSPPPVEAAPTEQAQAEQPTEPSA